MGDLGFSHVVHVGQPDTSDQPGLPPVPAGGCRGPTDGGNRRGPAGFWTRPDVLAVLSLVASGLVGAAVVTTTTPAPAPVRQAPAASRPREFVGPPAPPKPVARVIPTPNDALRWAYDDLITHVPPGARYYTRYLFDALGSPTSAKTSSLTLNLLSRGSAPVLPVAMANGHLVRFDIRWYAPSTTDQAEWQALWEDFRFDPLFSRLLTKQTLKLYGLTEAKLRPVVVKETTYKTIYEPGPDPKHPLAKKVPVITERYVSPFHGVDVLADDPPDLDPLLLHALRRYTGTSAPVVDHRYFKFRALSSIQEKGAYADIWGGRWLELSGTKTAEQTFGKGFKVNGRKPTDEDALFHSLGLGNVNAGESAQQFFDRLRSGQRIALGLSGVTGGPREIDFFETAATAGFYSGGSITGDLGAEDVTEQQHPILNLRRPFRRAREWIVPRGFNWLFALTNAVDGTLAREVPPNIAAARNIPAPHRTRLQPPIDCLDCHGKHDMWIPARNEVKDLVKAGRVDILGDQSGHTFLGDPAITDELRRLFMGDDRYFSQSVRDSAAKRFLEMMGPFPGADPTQSDIVRVATAALVSDYNGYWWSSVTPREALRDLGFDVPEKDAKRLFGLLVPIDRQGSTAYTQELGAVTFEDIRVSRLAEGMPTRRQDWAMVRSFAAERARRTTYPFGGNQAWLAKFGSN